MQVIIPPINSLQSVIDFGFLDNDKEVYYASKDSLCFHNIEFETIDEKFHIPYLSALKRASPKFILVSIDDGNLLFEDRLLYKDSLTIEQLRKILPYLPKEEQLRYGIIKKK